MKKLILTVLVAGLTTAISQTTLAFDFNTLISENSKAQKSLHSEIKKTVVDSQIAAQESTKNYIADEQETIHNTTKKDLLVFDKEKKHYRPAVQADQKRLAQELKDIE